MTLSVPSRGNNSNNNSNSTSTDTSRGNNCFFQKREIRSFDIIIIVVIMCFTGSHKSSRHSTASRLQPDALFVTISNFLLTLLAAFTAAAAARSLARSQLTCC